MTTNRKLIKSGNWGENVAWELYETDTLPQKELCTAVMCVAISVDGKIVLTRTPRGWGMLGGHIEEGESPEDTLHREAYEEGGFIIDQCKLFAIRKITAKTRAPHPQPGKEYPFPTSYMTYYWATTKQPLVPPTGDEVLESARFGIDEVVALDIPDQTEIEIAYETFENHILFSNEAAIS